jgi:HPt (histidine-containing phosphotransfer) domain-containing protein
VVTAAVNPEGVSAAVIDDSVLGALGRVRGTRQPEFVDQIIMLFIETALILIADLKHGLATSDSARLRHASHALKSCSATIGAGLLAARCEELEGLARAGSVLDAAARVEAIAHAYLLVQANLISRLAAPTAADQPDQKSAALHTQ